MTLILGIDIGTTSVKVVLIDQLNKDKILNSHSLPTNARIEKQDEPLHDEQNVNIILRCVCNCINKVVQDVGVEMMHTISKIAICGQMHGCIFWDHDHVVSGNNLTFDYGVDKLSNLITWQDSRCLDEFLKSLPVSKVSSLPLSTGFGCATILWLQNHKPNFLKKFNCCGTISDYLASRLCCLSKPVMSTQNAVGWGYFDSKQRVWDYSAMDICNFPVSLLPTVACPGTVLGNLNLEFGKISKKAIVVVAMGDMQCSVMSCQIKLNEAVLNLSTSCQLSMLVEQERKTATDPAALNQPKPVSVVPYFGDYNLITAASLNGGAVFAHFIQMLKKWTRQFAENVTEEEIYKRLMEAEPIPSSSSISCIPTIFGERHCPSVGGSFSNISSSDLQIPIIGRILARGILENTRSMFESGHSAKSIKHVWACGGAFSRNSLFREELVNHVFSDVPVSFMRDADAAYGAALAISE